MARFNKQLWDIQSKNAVVTPLNIVAKQKRVGLSIKTWRKQHPNIDVDLSLEDRIDIYCELENVEHRLHITESVIDALKEGVESGYFIKDENGYYKLK